MEKYTINPRLIELSNEASEALVPYFEKVKQTCEYNCNKVLKAFIDNEVAYSHFEDITGYGFFDGGRDKMEAVFAQVFGAEDALVRPQIMSGTNAIWLTLSGLLHSGDTMISITGEPYDPLRNIIGTMGDSKLSLMNNGVKYEQIELIDNDFDYKTILERVKQGGVTLIEIQRSRGYSHREGISIAQMEKVCAEIKAIDPNIIIMCDNCYGEFVETREPTEVGVDIIAGSLMHNLGGGIASSGGYVIGKEALVSQVAERLTAPCIGKELGANYNQLVKFFKGLFFAPRTVSEAVKSGIFTSYIAEKLGYTVSPRYDYPRSDIIQTIDFNEKQKLVDFAVALQKYSPVDSIFAPVPSEFPGYPHEEIMACGSFTQGSTIEFSCDGPVIYPYTAFMQGGLIFEYSKPTILWAFSSLLDK